MASLKNVTIREKAKGKNVKLWEIADKLGIADCQLSREMRHELPAEKQEKILKIIDELAAER